MAGPEERKVNTLAELPRSIEPPRDLWPQIQARLEAEQTRTPLATAPVRARAGSLRWLAAAAMVASIGVGVFIGAGSPADGLTGGDGCCHTATGCGGRGQRA